MPFVLSDCLNAFLNLPPNELDAVVDDPPAGIGFMGRSWDNDRGGRAQWVAWLAERMAAQLRACKPGAYSLTWALPRTSHWTMLALEDAGWRIVDVITHHFGQGWPKNGETQLKPASEHWVLAQKPLGRGLTIRGNVERYGVGVLGIDACRVERGIRPVMIHNERGARSNALSGKSTGASPSGDLTNLGSWPTNVVLSHCPGCEERGTRVVASGTTYEPEADKDRPGAVYNGKRKYQGRTLGYAEKGQEEVPAFDCVASCSCGASALRSSGGAPPRCEACGQPMSWACPVAEMDAQSGSLKNGGSPMSNPCDYMREGIFGGGLKRGGNNHFAGDEGGASRFFPTFRYSSKASTAERDAGCEHLLWRRNKPNPFGFDRVTLKEWRALDGRPRKTGDASLEPDCRERAQGNVHPTVKPLDLCEWLLNLAVPRVESYTARRRIGDGFCGSGSIPIQAWRMGMDFFATDVSPEALEIARARLHYWQGGLHVQVREDRPARAQKRASTPSKRPQEELEEQTRIPGT